MHYFNRDCNTFSAPIPLDLCILYELPLKCTEYKSRRKEETNVYQIILIFEIGSPLLSLLTFYSKMNNLVFLHSVNIKYIFANLNDKSLMLIEILYVFTAVKATRKWRK